MMIKRRRIIVWLLRIKYHMRIMSTKKTINQIIKHELSVTRFGDGEFNIMLCKAEPKFQRYTPELSKKLFDVMKSNNPNMLICITQNIMSTYGKKEKIRRFWEKWCLENLKEINKLISSAQMKKYEFGDASITRLTEYENKKFVQRRFLEIRKIWDKKNILIVEGNQSRLGVGNDLFSNSNRVHRILCPNKNAFDSYQEIKEAIIKYYDNDLLLLALGPTATVLAEELSADGLRAIDIGHIDIEYEWFIRGADKKVIIPGKFLNEISGGDKVIECTDEKYLSEIVVEISC